MKSTEIVGVILLVIVALTVFFYSIIVGIVLGGVSLIILGGLLLYNRNREQYDEEQDDSQFNAIQDTNEGQNTQQVVTQEAVFCSQCGNPIPPNSKFCNNCGNPVSQAKQESQDYQRGFIEGQKHSRSQNLVTPFRTTKYCQKCGHTNDANAPYCVECGNVSFATNPPRRISRPTGVTIIGIFQILVSIVYIAVGLLLGALLSFLLPSLGVIIAVASFLPLIFAFCLFSGRNWARILMMVGAVFDLFALPIGTIFGIIILYYFTRPRVVAYFKQEK